MGRATSLPILGDSFWNLGCFRAQNKQQRASRDDIFGAGSEEQKEDEVEVIWVENTVSLAPTYQNFSVYAKDQAA